MSVGEPILITRYYLASLIITAVIIKIQLDQKRCLERWKYSSAVSDGILTGDVTVVQGFLFFSSFFEEVHRAFGGEEGLAKVRLAHSLESAIARSLLSALMYLDATLSCQEGSCHRKNSCRSQFPPEGAIVSFSRVRWALNFNLPDLKQYTLLIFFLRNNP